jgi:hypothetical protein
MAWPPRVGERLPRADEPVGVREKLCFYSLDPSHLYGGPKARGFAVILGITIDSVDHVEAEIYSSILRVPITSIRPNPPHGINCVVEFPLQGVGRYSGRSVPLRTIWELVSTDSRPRLVNAFLKSDGRS